MIKKTHILFLFIITTCFVRAQQLPLYSQYMVNDYMMNPAIGGKNDYFIAMSANRYQWIGITDAPRTYTLSVHGPAKKKNIGLGGYLFTDIVGPTRRIGLDFSYSYHLKITDELKLSMALSGGILQYSVDASKITLHDPVDLVISNGYQRVLLPDFGTGFYLYSKKLYFGFSVPQIFPAKIRFFDYTTNTQGKLATHFYASAGYKIDLYEDLYIEPSVQFKYVKPAPMQFDIGARAVYKEKIWLGGAFRTHDAFSMMAGYVYRDNLAFSYAYDFTTTNIKNYSTGTHEIIFSVKFGKQVGKFNPNTPTPKFSN